MSTLRVSNIDAVDGTQILDLSNTGATWVGNQTVPDSNIIKRYVTSSETPLYFAGYINNPAGEGVKNYTTADPPILGGANEHPVFNIVVKPSSVDSIFKLTYNGNFQTASGWIYTNFVRAAPNASKTGFNNGDTLYNLSHMDSGGDGLTWGAGTYNDIYYTSASGQSFVRYDRPNTLDYVRYSMVGSYHMYLPSTYGDYSAFVVEELSPSSTQIATHENPLVTSD